MENIKEKIFNFAYGAALKDATMQKAFEGEKRYLRGCSYGKELVKEYIDGIFNGETVRFYSTAEKVEEAFNKYIKEKGGKTKDDKEQHFTFGNTQKLINMTAKYMYMATYAREDLKGNFAQCHCPMDGIMIERVIKAVKKRKDSSGLPDFVHLQGWKNMLQQPWSKIESDNKTQYENFQALVSVLAKEQGCSPIEYDYVMWEEDVDDSNLDPNVEK